MITIKTVFILLRLFNSVSDLAHATRRYAPSYLTEESAFTHALAAKAAETPNISAELLLGLAFVESRYQPLATSRMENGVRKTGIPTWKSPRSNVSGPYFCGVTQVMAEMSWNKCVKFRNIFYAYKKATTELELWLKSPYCKYTSNKMQCALRGYGGGYPAIIFGTSTYPARVLSRASAIKKSHNFS